MSDYSQLFIDVAHAVLARAGADFDVNVGEFWCMVTPPDPQLVGQGWKLHVSATSLAAPTVLHLVTEVLAAEGCAFKFARGPKELGQLLSRHRDRGNGGKFIAVYPRDDQQFCRLAKELDQVTDGLPGPKILSDRQLRPGSSVYYRYGVFNNPRVFTDEGVFESMLIGPNGEFVKDERPPFFRTPPWIGASPVDPEADSGAAGRQPGEAAPAALLIGGRFTVHSAIQHSYQGGIYRATDQDTGAAVVLKQARPHVMSSAAGTDTRDLLRHEAQMLETLSPLGLAPEKVALIQHQDNLFLAMESVPGVNLHHWVADRLDTDWAGCGPPVDTAVDMAGQLMDIVAAVHECDLVLCDLKPTNVMVTPDGRLRLIDLECVSNLGSRAQRFGSPGYAAPEIANGPWFGPAPEQRADLFSLGVTIMYLASGIGPMKGSDRPAGRTLDERLKPVLERAAADFPALQRLSPVIAGLIRENPETRWSLRQAREYLHDAKTAPTRPAGGPKADRPATAEIDRLLTDGLRHLLRTATPREQRLWKPDSDAKFTDACNVQHGAAGVLGVLTRAARVLDNDDLRDGVAMTAAWIDQRLFDIPRILPGLYAGRSGTAWALHDAARYRGDEATAARAHELVTKTPLRWPNPDISYGAAGGGMARLHLWAVTGDNKLLDHSVQTATDLLRSAHSENGRLVWRNDQANAPDDISYGFAHGVAGIGAFLLYAGLASGRTEFLDAAQRAGESLETILSADDMTTSRPRGDRQKPGLKRHWCHGSSGIGTFLIRLWAVTAEQRFKNLAQTAAHAVYQSRWHSGNTACHGLAGDGDFLLDLADLTGEQQYRDRAWDLAAVMHSRHVIVDGLAVLTFGSEPETTAAYGTGLAGPLGFLLRLRHGGPRWWMPDQLIHTTKKEHSLHAADST